MLIVWVEWLGSECEVINKWCNDDDDHDDVKVLLVILE